MKHIQNVSAARFGIEGVGRKGLSPEFADAKTDFLNALWADIQDFIFAKKNEVII